MRVNGYKFPLWLILFVGLSLVFTVVSIYMVVSIMTVGPADFAVAPTEFSSSVYIPENSVVCPGDKLRISYSFRVVEENPFAVTIIETWANSQGNNVVRDQHPEYAISTHPLGWTDLTIERVVPDLPSGEWQFLRVATTPSSSRHPAFFSSPFTIPDTCIE